MARTLEEIDTFATAVAGRTKIGLMIETLEIMKLLREVAHRELSFVYVGLQDLMIATALLSESIPSRGLALNPLCSFRHLSGRVYL